MAHKVLARVFVRYNMLSDSDLLRLPVHELSAADAVVVVWTTNKLKQQRFVKDRLFPQWHVTFLAEWYWLKVVYTAACCCNHNRN